jgi:hypothetical protein
LMSDLNKTMKRKEAKYQNKVVISMFSVWVERLVIGQNISYEWKREIRWMRKSRWRFEVFIGLRNEK